VLLFSRLPFPLSSAAFRLGLSCLAVYLLFYEVQLLYTAFTEGIKHVSLLGE